jgi:hypothetical protein
MRDETLRNRASVAESLGKNIGKPSKSPSVRGHVTTPDTLSPVAHTRLFAVHSKPHTRPQPDVHFAKIALLGTRGFVSCVDRSQVDRSQELKRSALIKARSSPTASVRVTQPTRFRPLHKRAPSTVTMASSAEPTEATQQHVYPPPAELSTNAYCKSLVEYKKMYKQSIDDPETFFGTMARENFHWEVPFDTVGPQYNFDMTKGPIDINWFQGGKTNICYNALDKHVLDGHGDDVAILWEGNSPDEQSSHTYQSVLDQVKKFANVLKKKGIKKGDTVTLYMPMVVELAVACLACARIGAVHSVVFGGFSPEAIRGRLADAQSTVIVTCDAVMRGAKPIQLKTQVDATLALGSVGTGDGTAKCVQSVVVFKRLDGTCPMVDGRDTWWHDEMDSVTSECDVEWMDSEAPLFMLYTSGSTGTPKGIVHTTAGYMLGAWSTFKYTFDYKPGEVFWCTADIGWITGHSYIVYGPLLARATTVMFEGARCASRIHPPRFTFNAGDCLSIHRDIQDVNHFVSPIARRPHVSRPRPVLGDLRKARGEPGACWLMVSSSGNGTADVTFTSTVDCVLLLLRTHSFLPFPLGTVEQYRTRSFPTRYRGTYRTHYVSSKSNPGVPVTKDSRTQH